MLKASFFSILFSAVALCVIPSHTKIATTNQYTFSSLKQDPYVSGSLGFASGSPSLSHLKVGAKIPIRLGRVKRTQIAATDLGTDITSNANYTGQAIYQYDDDPTVAVFGYITVVTIDINSINFTYTLYNTNGTLLKNSSKTLSVNAKSDLNGDGKYDVQYVTQINSKRPANSVNRYLTFISSQTDLTSNGYCYMPEYLSTLSYANGNLGYNQSGFAIIRPIAKSSSGAWTLPAGTDVRTGDFVMNIDGGTYIKVTDGTKAKAAASMDELKLVSTSVDNIGEVFADIHFVNTGSNFTSEKSAANFKAYTNQAEYDAARAAAASKLSAYQYTMTIPMTFDAMKDIGDGLSVGLKDIAGHIGIDADLDVTWHRVKGKFGGMVLIDAKPTLSFSGTKQWVSKPYQDIPFSLAPLARTSFFIGPVLIDLDLIPEAGILINVNLKTTSKMNNKIFVATGFTSTFSFGWSGGTADAQTYYASGLLLDMDLAAAVGSTAYIRPYIGIGPRIDVYKILFAQITARRWIGPEFSTVLSADQNSFSTNLGVYSGQGLHLAAGARVALELWGLTYHKTWSKGKDFAESKSPMWEWTYQTPIFTDPVTGTQYSAVAVNGTAARTSSAGRGLAYLSAIFNVLF